MCNVMINDLTFFEVLSDEAAAIHGGRDNKPSAPTGLGSSFDVLLKNTIGLPVSEDEWIPAVGMQADNVTPL